MDLRSATIVQRGAAIREARTRAGIGQRTLQRAWCERLQIPWDERRQVSRLSDMERGKLHLSAERTQQYLGLVEELAATEGGDGEQPPTPPDWRQKAKERRTSAPVAASGAAVRP